MDPNKPIEVDFRIDSPQVVVYRLWYRRPGDSQWTVFANGTDEAESSASAHRHIVGPLPEDSRIAYHVIFSGNPQMYFRVVITVSQDGVELPGSGVRVEGYTDDSGVAARQGEVPL